jgi:DNA-binding MarR family transcriptional regulator
MDEALRSEKINSISEIFDNLTIVYPVLMRKIMNNSMLKSKTGFSNMEVWVLEGLETGELNPSEISKIFSVSKPNVTTLVNKLVDGGYVQRSHDDKDRRVIKISITDKGRKLLIKRTRIVKKYMLGVFAKLSEDEIIDISKAMEVYNNLVMKMNRIL